MNFSTHPRTSVYCTNTQRKELVFKNPKILSNLAMGLKETLQLFQEPEAIVEPEKG